MPAKLAKQVERLRRIVAKGSHYLVLTAPTGGRPSTKRPRKRAA